MSQFDESKIRRGNDGKFAEKPPAAEAGDVELAGAAGDRPEHLARLDDVLARHGLRSEDVPGLEEAWDDRYAKLSSERPVSAPEYAEKMLGNPDWGRHRGGPYIVVEDGDVDDGYRQVWSDSDFEEDTPLLVQVHTRNGGGNREHYHDSDDDYEDGCTACATDTLQQHPLHVTDFDNDFDSTYADFVFKVPGQHRAPLIEALHHNKDALEWGKADAEVRAFESEKIAPWNLLAADGEAEKIAAETKAARADQLSDYLRDREREQLGRESDLLTAATTGQVAAGKENLRIEITEPKEGSTYPKRHVFSMRQVAKNGAEYLAAKEKAAQLARLRTEIETSVSPELREYLIGDLPEKSYTTTEGTGRKKRSVTRTYTPETPFRKDEHDTERDVTRYGEQVAEATTVLSRSIEGHKARLEADARASELLGGELADRSWALGWTGKDGDLPPRPAKSELEDDGLW